MKNYKINPSKGFTLIEIMIVVAILGIISSIALPSYVEYVRKGKRADAKVELLRIAQMQESYFVENLSYAKDLTTSTGGLGLGTTVLSEQEEYAITISSENSAGAACSGLAANACSAFTLTATPQGGQASDTKCKNLTFSNTGVKGISGTDTVKNCWK